MEITCTRCHQTVQTDNCYCPACGLPQLVYTAETPNAEAAPDKWNETPPRDAGTVDWKPAMRAALIVAVPAGLLSSGVSPLSIFGLIWMAAAASWAVVLYMRSQRPAWITLGAGARIGLVTGLMGAWLVFAINGGAMFVQRFLLHQSSQIDAEWKATVDLNQQMALQMASGMSQANAAQMQAARSQVQALMMSPWGHAGFVAFAFAFNAFFLLFFAAGGGVLGARFLARSRRPEV
jgi:hypothetical protein